MIAGQQAGKLEQQEHPEKRAGAGAGHADKKAGGEQNGRQEQINIKGLLGPIKFFDAGYRSMGRKRYFKRFPLETRRSKSNGPARGGSTSAASQAEPRQEGQLLRGVDQAGYRQSEFHAA